MRERVTLDGLRGADLRAKQNRELDASGLTASEVAAVRVATMNVGRAVMLQLAAVRGSVGHEGGRLFCRHVIELLQAVNGDRGMPS